MFHINLDNTTGQAICLPEGSLFCDEQRLDYLGPCWDGLSCIVKEMIHMAKSCQKNGSGKTHYKLLFVSKNVKLVENKLIPNRYYQDTTFFFIIGQDSPLTMENWKTSCKIWCKNSSGQSYCCSWINHIDAFI